MKIYSKIFLNEKVEKGDILILKSNKKVIVKDLGSEGELFVQDDWTDKGIGYGGVWLLKIKDIKSNLKRKYKK